MFLFFVLFNNPIAILDSEDQFAPGMIFLETTGSQAENGFDWIIINPQNEQLNQPIVSLYDDNRNFVFGTTRLTEPGDYTFILLAFGATVNERDFAVKTINITNTPAPGHNPFQINPSRPETIALLNAAKDYGNQHADPIAFAFALQFFAQEIEANRSSPAIETTKQWIGDYDERHGGAPPGPEASTLSATLSNALRPAYQIQSGEFQLYDRPYLAEVIKVLASGLYQGGLTQ